MNSNCAQHYWLIADRRDPSKDSRNNSGTHFGFSSLFASKAANVPCRIPRRERALGTRLAAFFHVAAFIRGPQLFVFFLSTAYL